MSFDFSSLFDFSYTLEDKSFLLKILTIDGLGRRTAAKIIFSLKKSETRQEDFWGSFIGILNNNLTYKKLIVTSQINEIDQKYYSIINEFKKSNIRVVAFWEDEYPGLLKQTADFPLLLFVKGDISVLCTDSIAVIGTRKATSYGEQVTKKLVCELVDYDYTIISGCMYGIDAIAHQQTIDSGGKTIAVLGYGFNYITPERLAPLQEKILQSGGCLITEYLPYVVANKGTFPERNRIVAGISLGVLVTEAALKSGTHITVDCALDAGREVFAVPGSIYNPYTLGTKHLLNQGAKLVSSGADIVAEFKKIVTIPDSIDVESFLRQLQIDKPTQKVLKELLFLPQTTNDLVLKTGLTIKELLTLLGMLELENIVENEAGLWWCVLSYSSHSKIK